MPSSAATRRITFVIASLLFFAVVGMLYVWVRNARDQSRSIMCTNNLKQIGLALQNYRQVHGTLPPAILTDIAGKPINSWRAEITPSFWYTFRTGNPDAGRAGYDYSEPWNGPNNSKLNLAGQHNAVFRCPCETSTQPAVTSY